MVITTHDPFSPHFLLAAISKNTSTYSNTVSQLFKFSLTVPYNKYNRNAS